MLHVGKLILQSSTRFSVSQKVLAKTDTGYSVFEITELSGSNITLRDEAREIVVEPTDLYRLVISNGEKFAPLQNMDWPRVIEEGQKIGRAHV